MSLVKSIEGLSLQISPGSESDAFNSAMKNHLIPSVWYLSDQAGTSIKGASTLKLSILESLPNLAMYSSGSTNRTGYTFRPGYNFTSDAYIDNSGAFPKIVSTGDSDYSWLFSGYGSGFGGDHEYYLPENATQSQIKAGLEAELQTDVDVTLTGTHVFVFVDEFDYLRESDYRYQGGESEYTHQPQSITVAAPPSDSIEVTVESVQYGYKVKHDEVGNGSPEDFARLTFGDASRTKFGNLAEMALALRRGATAFDQISDLIGEDPTGIIIDQKSRRCYITSKDINHGVESMSIEIDKPNVIDFGE